MSTSLLQGLNSQAFLKKKKGMYTPYPVTHAARSIILQDLNSLICLFLITFQSQLCVDVVKLFLQVTFITVQIALDQRTPGNNPTVQYSLVPSGYATVVIALVLVLISELD